MDRSYCNDWKVAISFSKCNLSHFEGVTTHHQTLQTWIGLNLTRYRNLNALLQALLHALLYVFSEIFLVLSYLQRVATRYHHFLKIYILIYIFFINLTVTRGKALQIAQTMLHWEKMYCNAWGNTLKLWYHVALWPIYIKLTENVR